MMNPWARFETRRGCSWSVVSLSRMYLYPFFMLHLFFWSCVNKPKLIIKLFRE